MLCDIHPTAVAARETPLCLMTSKPPPQKLTSKKKTKKQLRLKCSTQPAATATMTIAMRTLLFCLVYPSNQLMFKTPSRPPAHAPQHPLPRRHLCPEDGVDVGDQAGAVGGAVAGWAWHSTCKMQGWVVAWRGRLLQQLLTPSGCLAVGCNRWSSASHHPAHILCMSDGPLGPAQLS